MLKTIKVAVIGAGSTYTPELFDGFIKRRRELPVSEFHLMDIDKDRLSVVGGMAQRMLDKNTMNASCMLTCDLEEALSDADFILTQMRVGKQDARILDEKIPLKYDLIGQETTGIGGFMKAMRTIPVMLEVASKMEKLCPDAWLINFANPSGIISETLLNHTQVKMLGLCNAPWSMKKAAMERVPRECRDVRMEYIGLNHLSWITAIYCDGCEILQEQLWGKFNFGSLKNIPELELDAELLKSIRGIPSGYLSYYYYRDRQLKHLKAEEKSRGEICREIENELLELYKQPGLAEKPAILDKRGGAMYSDAAVSLISAIYNDKGEEHVVNVKNNGALDFMANDDIVEISCKIGKEGAAPIPVRNFDNDHIKGMMKVIKHYEKHTVKAGMNGDRREALSALLVHPLVGDFLRAKDVLEELLELNKAYLPRFFSK